MTSEEKMKKKILQWLVEKKDKSNKIIDEKWNIKEEDGIITAQLGNTDIKIKILFKPGFVILTLSTGLETAALEADTRLDLYRKLLLLNYRLQLARITLSGLGDEITIRTDLDLSSLGKEEFNDALTSLLLGVHLLMKEVFEEEEEGDEGEEDEEAEVQKDTGDIMDIIAKTILEGGSKENLVNLLVKKTSLTREEAKKFVDALYRAASPTKPGG